jgi:hypothetical protein
VVHRLYIPATLFWLQEKMKHGPVVPHVIAVMREIDRGDVSLDPGYGGSPSAKALTRKRECSSGNIKDGHVLVALREKLIHQSGGPPAHINDLSCRAGSRTVDQC